MESKYRVGRFTSSRIGDLMTYAKNGVDFGKPALTYIAEKNMERKLGRSLNIETNSKPTSWGLLLEKRVLEDLLGIDYRPCSKETIEHPDYDFWAGSPDAEKFDEGKTVVDIKCPFTLKSFCQFADCESIQDIFNNHPDGETYYWQLVSNAILIGAKYAELIIYCPYQSELATIRDMANYYDGDQNKVAWMNWTDDRDMPYLIDGGNYKNVNIFRFEVPEQSKEELTERVIRASKLLV
jgi:hypothetical protein